MELAGAVHCVPDAQLLPQVLHGRAQRCLPGLNLEDGKYDASKPVLTNDKALFLSFLPRMS